MQKKEWKNIEKREMLLFRKSRKPLILLGLKAFFWKNNTFFEWYIESISFVYWYKNDCHGRNKPTIFVLLPCCHFGSIADYLSNLSLAFASVSIFLSYLHMIFIWYSPLLLSVAALQFLCGAVTDISVGRIKYYSGMTSNLEAHLMIKY